MLICCIVCDVAGAHPPLMASPLMASVLKSAFYESDYHLINIIIIIIHRMTS